MYLTRWIAEGPNKCLLFAGANESNSAGWLGDLLLQPGMAGWTQNIGVFTRKSENIYFHTHSLSTLIRKASLCNEQQSGIWCREQAMTKGAENE